MKQECIVCNEVKEGSYKYTMMHSVELTSWLCKDCEKEAEKQSGVMSKLRERLLRKQEHKCE